MKFALLRALIEVKEEFPVYLGPHLHYHDALGLVLEHWQIYQQEG